MMNRPVHSFSQGWDFWIWTATLWIIFLDWFNTHAKLAQPYEKEILTPSLLYSPAWCFLCYAGISFCVAAQCTGCRNGSSWEKNPVSFGGFYSESVPNIPKPRKLNCTNNCHHYLGTARQGRRKCFKNLAEQFNLERSLCMENTTGFKLPSALGGQVPWATLFLITCILDQCHTFINIHD